MYPRCSAHGKCLAEPRRFKKARQWPAAEGRYQDVLCAGRAVSVISAPGLLGWTLARIKG